MSVAADTLLHDDSLRRATEQLFIKGALFGPFEVADTVASIPPPTAADLFGVGSFIATTDVTAAAALPLASNPLFQCLVLLLTAVYAFTIYQHTGSVMTLFLRTPHNSSGSPTDSHGGTGYSQFLNTVGLMGLMVIGLLFVKAADRLLPEGLLPYNAAAGISLIATAVLIILATMQGGMLQLIGSITLTQTFTTELLYIKRISLAMATITIAPVILLYTLCPPNTGSIWLYIAGSGAFIILLHFLIKSLRLFISKKVSILHWFLYLCTIEIFPISLLWLLLGEK